VDQIGHLVCSLFLVLMGSLGHLFPILLVQSKVLEPFLLRKAFLSFFCAYFPVFVGTILELRNEKILKVTIFFSIYLS